MIPSENCTMCGRPVHVEYLVGLVHTETRRKECMEPPGAMIHLPLTPGLRSILGRPNFACISIATLLRHSGFEIARKAEDEQATVIWWLLQQYIKHGEDKWEKEANDALIEVHKQYIKSLSKEVNNA